MDAKKLAQFEEELIENGSADFFESHKKYGYDILKYLFSIGKIRFNANPKESVIMITPSERLLKEE